MVMASRDKLKRRLYQYLITIVEEIQCFLLGPQRQMKMAHPENEMQGTMSGQRKRQERGKERNGKGPIRKRLSAPPEKAKKADEVRFCRLAP
jgi:hypothetical protein